jgi:hypothetical protein
VRKFFGATDTVATSKSQIRFRQSGAATLRERRYRLSAIVCTIDGSGCEPNLDDQAWRVR